MANAGLDIPRSRGRPKGSGIDDRATLARLNELLQREPGLPPTTALKRLGIGDPSTIRRLRDKHRLAPPAPIKPTRAPVTKAAAPRSASAPLPSQPPNPPANPQQDPRIAEAFLKAFLQSGPVTPRSAPASVASSVAPPAIPAPQAPPSQPPPQQHATSNTSPRMPFPFPMPWANPAMGMGANPMAALGPMMGINPMAMSPMSMNPMNMLSMFGQMSGQPPFPVPGFASAPTPNHPTATAATGAARQMEAMKLAIEAMTSIARLQAHVMEHAMAYSPLTAMLQGQAMLGQMLTAALTGQLAPKPTPPKQS